MAEEVLLHRGTQPGRWRPRPAHEALLAAFQLSAQNYAVTRLRYDLRKLQARALLERDSHRYAYRRTDKASAAHGCSFSCASASVVPWPTAYSTGNLTQRRSPSAKSKLPTTSLTLLFTASLICLLP